MSCHLYDFLRWLRGFDYFVAICRKEKSYFYFNHLQASISTSIEKSVPNLMHQILFPQSKILLYFTVFIIDTTAYVNIFQPKNNEH